MSDYIEMAQGKLGRVIVVRLRPGADVLLSLEEACREHNITNGVILSAIGSLQSRGRNANQGGLRLRRDAASDRSDRADQRVRHHLPR